MFRDLINKYPKEVLKENNPITLDAEWKKALVAFLAIARINAQVMGYHQKQLYSQISESFDDNMRDNKPMDMTPDNLKEVKIVFRIKNLLLAMGDVISPEISKIDLILSRHKDEIIEVNKDLWLFYVGAKAGIQQEIHESRVLAAQIDATLVICFEKAISEGINLEQIERETLQANTTRADIRVNVDRIYTNLNISEMESI